MRLDKFLKTSRIIKRRSLAKEACDRGMVMVNGRPAKAGTTVKPGDVVSVAFSSKTLRLEVLQLDEHAPARLAAGLYRLLEPDNESDIQEPNNQ